jgi:hypothetical protein
MSFTFPRQIRLMDADPEKSCDLQVAGQNIHSDPSWAGKGTIVAVIGPAKGDMIALIDVSDPSEPKVKEILWRKEDGPELNPAYPIYWPANRRCIFVGVGNDGESLYSVVQGQAGSAKPLGPRRRDPKITQLSFSPDGRYLLYSVRGPGPASGDRPSRRK